MPQTSDNNNIREVLIHELVERIRNGDRNAENEFFDKFGKVIDVMVKQQLHKHGYFNINDVASEVKRALLQNLREGRFIPGQKASLKTYLTAIVKNQTLRFYRNIKRNERVETHDKLPDYLLEQSEESNLERREIRDVIQSCIKELAPKYQSVIILFFYDKLKPSEIAEILQCEPQEVYDSLSYAKRLLQKRLNSKKYFPDSTG